MATVTLSSGYSNRYVREIETDDPFDLNDFPVRAVWDTAVTDFAVGDVSATGTDSGGNIVPVSIVGFREVSGEKYEFKVSPPDTGSGTIVITIASNVVQGGNPQATLTINYTDTVVATQLFNYETVVSDIRTYSRLGKNRTPVGIFVEGSRIRLFCEVTGVSSTESQRIVSVKNGSRLSAEELSFPGTHSAPTKMNLDKINDRWFARVGDSNGGNRSQWAYLGESAFTGFVLTDFCDIDPNLFGGYRDSFNRFHRGFISADINLWGLFFRSFGGRLFAQNFDCLSDIVSSIPIAEASESSNTESTQTPIIAAGDRIYGMERGIIHAYQTTSRSENEELRNERIKSPYSTGQSIGEPVFDIAVYGDEFYYTGRVDDSHIYKIDLSKYRLPVVRDRILPQILKEGERLNLNYFADGAEKILFDIDFDAPAYLSVNSDRELVVASGQISEDVCMRLDFTAFNRSGETPFSFYIVILKQNAPEWRNVQTLPVDNGETVDLKRLVDGADSVTWKSGFTVPSGFTVADSKLTISGLTSGTTVTVELTATNAEGSSDKTFDVHVRVPLALTASENFDYRVLIAGIDVSEDVMAVSGIRHSLDVVHPNEFISNNASFVLSSDLGKYDGQVDGNFWAENNLNKNGYLESVQIWVDISDTGQTVSKLLFDGIIDDPSSSITGITATLNCVSATQKLKRTQVETVGLEKYSAMHRESETYQGVYAPDTSLLPIQRPTASVVSGATPVPVRGYANALSDALGVLECYVTENQVLTRGGYLDEDPLIAFKTPYQQRSIDFLIRTLSEGAGYFNSKIAIETAVPAARPHIVSRGNTAFNVEPVKTSRTVVDWIHDATNDVFYQVLSHPTGAIRDKLVMYTPTTENYETLLTFDPGIEVTQLTSADFQTFYFLATRANNFDRTESPTPPNYNESVFDNWDSSRETEDTRILKYVKSTGALTTFVAGNNAFPPQIGLHYMAGFENDRHIRWREGVFTEARSTFKVHNNELYYRFAKWNTFGVAKAALNGTTSAVISADSDDYFNTLNFDFDIVANGDIYMGFANGTFSDSRLRVRKYDATLNQSGDIVNKMATLTDLTEIDDLGGAYLGCHEVIYANEVIYFVVPIQRCFRDDTLATFRDIKKSAGAVLYCVDIHTSELTVLQRYDYVQLSCRSLTLHQNEVYFAEYPNASTHFQPSNADLDGWDANTRQNTVPSNRVWLKKIVNGVVSNVTSPWYTDHFFNATAVPMVSDGEKLHAIVRYADRFEISAIDSDASNPENEQWVTFGKEIPFYVGSMPSGSLHAIMVEFAKLSNARLEIVGNRFRFVDVDPFEALLSTGLSDSASQLNYKDANKEFPVSGYVLIDGEIIAYSNRTAARLSGLTRGVGGTTAAAHTRGNRVLFLDKVIAMSSIDDPYEDINIQIDTDKFYNTVKDSGDLAEVRNSESIAAYGQRTFTQDLALSDNQIPWQRFINAKTLNRLKDIKSLVQIQMLPSFYLDIGDIVTFAYADEILMPIQVIDIRYTSTGGENPVHSTEIIAQEVVPLPRLSFGTASVGNQTWTQYAEITPLTLPAAEDPKDTFIYHLEGLPAGMVFDAETRTVSGAPIAVVSSATLTYTVTDSENPISNASLEFTVTVNAAALAFVKAQADITVEVGTEVSEGLTRARGGNGRLTPTLTGNLTDGLSFNAIGDRIVGTPTEYHGNRALTHRVTDESSTAVTDTFNIQSILANRLMVADGRYLRSYGYENSRHALEDVAPDGLTSFTNGIVRGDRIFLVNGGRSLLVYDRTWRRINSEERTFDFTLQGIAWTPAGFWVTVQSARRIRFWDENWVEQSSREFNVSYSGAYDTRAIAATAAKIYVLYNQGQVRVWTLDGRQLSPRANAGNVRSLAVTPHGVVAGNYLYDYGLNSIRTLNGALRTGFIALNPINFEV